MTTHNQIHRSIHIIAAVANNGVIGKTGTIPWDIPADLRHFKELTMGSTVIMGRRTYESIGRPLPGRQNIVVTSTQKAIEGCQIAGSLAEALALAENGKAFVIGGAMLYEDALPIADVLELTFVDAEPEGDTYFPEVDWTLFEEIKREAYSGEPDYMYATYRRK